MPTGRLAGQASLRAAVEAGIAGRRPAVLATRADHLMAAYRSGELPGKPIICTDEDAAAYAAYRMPATAAAAAAAIRQTRESLPGWAPASLLDLGAGTGGTAWALAEELPGIGSVTLLEQSAESAGLGRAILAESGSEALRDADWRKWRLAASGGHDSQQLPAADLVTAGYLLGELSDPQQRRLVELTMAAGSAILFIEPGSPAGHQRILAARTQLVTRGFAVVAPCPHQFECPLDVQGDWCHFGTRVPRSVVHRQAKGADLGYEDEKFSFVAAIRGVGASLPGASLPGARIVRRPQQRKHLVSLSLCVQDGTARQQLVTKRTRPDYRAARKASWGDRWETGASSASS